MGNPVKAKKETSGRILCLVSLPLPITLDNLFLPLSLHFSFPDSCFLARSSSFFISCVPLIFSFSLWVFCPLSLSLHKPSLGVRVLLCLVSLWLSV